MNSELVELFDKEGEEGGEEEGKGREVNKNHIQEKIEWKQQTTKAKQQIKNRQLKRPTTTATFFFKWNEGKF